MLKFYATLETFTGRFCTILTYTANLPFQIHMMDVLFTAYQSSNFKNFYFFVKLEIKIVACSTFHDEWFSNPSFF